jgi:hypothetical protein
MDVLGRSTMVGLKPTVVAAIGPEYSNRRLSVETRWSKSTDVASPGFKLSVRSTWALSSQLLVPTQPGVFT